MYRIKTECINSQNMNLKENQTKQWSLISNKAQLYKLLLTFYIFNMCQRANRCGIFITLFYLRNWYKYSFVLGTDLIGEEDKSQLNKLNMDIIELLSDPSSSPLNDDFSLNAWNTQRNIALSRFKRGEKRNQ